MGRTISPWNRIHYHRRTRPARSLANQSESFAHHTIREVETCPSQLFDQRARGRNPAADLRAKRQTESPDERHVQRLGTGASSVVVEDGHCARVRNGPSQDGRFARTEIPCRDRRRGAHGRAGLDPLLRRKRPRRVVLVGSHLLDDGVGDDHPIADRPKQVESSGSGEDDEGRGIDDWRLRQRRSPHEAGPSRP